MPSYIIEYKADASSAKTEIASLISSMERLENEIDQVNAKLSQVGANTNTGTATQQMQATAAQVDAVGQASTKATAQVNNLGASAQKAADSTTKLKNAAKDAGDEAVKLSVNSAMAVDEIQRLDYSAIKLNSTFLSVTAAALGMEAFRVTVEGISEAIHKARQFVVETSEEAAKLHERVREMRATDGKISTQEASQEVQNIMWETGATTQEATDFLERWKSTKPAAVEKGNWGLSEGDEQRAKIHGLRNAIATGLDPKLAGEIMPMIAIAERVESDDDLIKQMAIMQRLAIDGVGQIKPIMKTYSKLRGSMVRPDGGGAFQSNAELMAGISAFTTDSGNPSAVVHDMTQVWRELSLADSPTKAATFEKYGIKETDDFVTRVKKIAPLVEAAHGDERSEQQVLHDAGFKEKGAHRKIIQAVVDKQILFNRVAAATEAEETLTPEAVVAETKKFYDENPQRVVKAHETVARLQRGEDTLFEENVKSAAENVLISGKYSGTRSGGLLDSVADGFGVMPFLGYTPAHQSFQKAIALAGMREIAPDITERFPGIDINRSKGLMEESIDKGDFKKALEYIQAIGKGPDLIANINEHARSKMLIRSNGKPNQHRDPRGFWADDRLGETITGAVDSGEMTEEEGAALGAKIAAQASAITAERGGDEDDAKDLQGKMVLEALNARRVARGVKPVRAQHPHAEGENKPRNKGVRSLEEMFPNNGQPNADTESPLGGDLMKMLDAGRLRNAAQPQPRAQNQHNPTIPELGAGQQPIAPLLTKLIEETIKTNQILKEPKTVQRGPLGGGIIPARP